MHPPAYPPSAPARGQISVIIPVWRDHAELPAVLSILCRAREVGEVIVSFAQPAPGALELARSCGAVVIDAGAPSRGRQMDAGAALARGEWLFFHHVDTTITPAHLQALAAVAKEAEIVGGAFYRQFDERHPHLRCFAGVERWHNRTFGALYGDQSLFARRAVFTELGGFRGLPLMEDVDFSLRLRKRGNIRLLDPPIVSSPRKHLAQGPWRTTLVNATLLFLYHLGVSPQRLHAYYYGQRAGASPPLGELTPVLATKENPADSTV